MKDIDLGGFEVAGLLFFYVLGVNLGGDPLLGIIMVTITYISLFGHTLE